MWPSAVRAAGLQPIKMSNNRIIASDANRYKRKRIQNDEGEMVEAEVIIKSENHEDRLVELEEL